MKRILCHCSISKRKKLSFFVSPSTCIYTFDQTLILYYYICKAWSMKSFCCSVWAKQKPLSHFTSDLAKMTLHKLCDWGTFSHFCGCRCISSHTSMQWQHEAHKHILFLERTWHAGWEENTACQPGLINAHQPHSLHTDEESRTQRWNVHILTENSWQ